MCYPMSGIPSLMGYAESIGLTGHQIDASIEFERYILSTEALDRHRPPKRASRELHNAWRETRRTIAKQGNRAYRDGDFYLRDACLTHACNYYGERYPDTIFLKNRFLLRSFSFEISRDLQPAARYLLARRTHPLTTFFRKHIIPTIKTCDPRIVGISVSNEFQVIPSFLLAELVKRSLPDCHIVMGGKWPTRYVRAIQKHPELFFGAVDSISICDGEPTMDGLLAYLRNECSIYDVKNLLHPTKKLGPSKISNGGPINKEIFAGVAETYAEIFLGKFDGGSKQ